MQTTVTVGTRKHAHYSISAQTKILYIRSIQESYQIFHTQKIFKRNRTFETHLASKAKQNRFHHKMVNNKKIYYTGGSKRCNLCLEEKLNILKVKDNCLLNKRSEMISACQHKNRFQVKSLNKERNACYFNDNTPTFPP